MGASYMMSGFGHGGGRIKYCARKDVGGSAPRKIVASKGCGGLRPSTNFAARKHVHPTMKVEVGGDEEEEDEDDEDEEDEEDEMDEDELDEEEEE
jgi:hypothetical protein